MIISLPEEFIVPIIYKDNLRFLGARELKEVSEPKVKGVYSFENLDVNEFETAIKRSIDADIYSDLDEIYYKAIIKPRE